MDTSTALGTASPHRLVQPEVNTIGVVAGATDQAATPATSIHRQHRAPAVPLPAAAVRSITLADPGVEITPGGWARCRREIWSSRSPAG